MLRDLAFYSWKDTGVYKLVKERVNVEEIRKQMRHTSLEHTQRYINSLFEINYDIKGLDNKLF